ncbi:class I SAM-dependent methyltransferase [Salinactinospora qingdaonensis]|uniref:Methyltransferase domain-containing protein n=1 Tax=Salinactinospora qingdaonensis TaxID=702744 RepID=A0ABP7FYW8_9ACTN
MSMASASWCPPEWLELRESADAAARAPELLEPLRDHLPHAPRPGRPLVVRDLGCGTGSMGRWLSGRLPGPQHWILHDRDTALLAHAAQATPGAAADGAPVTVETRNADITRLRAADLFGTHVVTASALLDLLDADEVDRLAAACVTAGCPALLTLSVVGRVELDPAEELDADLAAAFDAHQRRLTHGRRLLGPDAVTTATEAFHSYGATVYTHPSPWRLDAEHAALTAEWLRGWVTAACEQRPELEPAARDYLSRRLQECEAGRLRAAVHHTDLLALPGDAPGAPR